MNNVSVLFERLAKECVAKIIIVESVSIGYIKQKCEHLFQDYDNTGLTNIVPQNMMEFSFVVEFVNWYLVNRFFEKMTPEDRVRLMDVQKTSAILHKLVLLSMLYHIPDNVERMTTVYRELRNRKIELTKKFGFWLYPFKDYEIIGDTEIQQLDSVKNRISDPDLKQICDLYREALEQNRK